MERETKQYLTMDIGGTYIKYGIMDSNFKEISSNSVATKKDPELFLNQLFHIAAEQLPHIAGIAISIGGFIDPETGVNVDYSVGENFRKYNLMEKLQEYTGMPVGIENDSNCAALAELHLGAGKECDDFCMITLGTGIGGAIIHNRELIRGRNFKAGEFGFTRIGRIRREDGYHYHGASATSSLVKKVSEALKKEVNGEYIFAHLKEAMVLKIYEEWAEDLTMVVGNAAVCMDTEKVIIGGGISAQKFFIQDLRTRVYDRFKPLSDYTKIEAAVLGNNAGKIGALIEFLKRKEER